MDKLSKNGHDLFVSYEARITGYPVYSQKSLSVYFWREFLKVELEKYR